MAKFSSFEQFKQGEFAHDLLGDGRLVARMDVAEAVPGFADMPDWVKAALHFAIKTGSRNATAGLLNEDPQKAYERVVDRMTAWSAGVWRAASESAGESRTSILARAVAEALGVELDDAISQIDTAIEEAVDAANLDKDHDPDKPKVRKVGNDLRNSLRGDPAIAPIYARMQAEEAAKRAEIAQTKTGESKLGALLKR